MRKETQALKLVLAVCVLAAVGCAFGVGAGANPYGVCAHVSRDEFGARVETYDMMALAGLGYVRSDFDWFQCQRAHGGVSGFLARERDARLVRLSELPRGVPAFRPACPSRSLLTSVAEFECLKAARLVKPIL